MRPKTLILIIAILIIAALGYWYFVMRSPAQNGTPSSGTGSYSFSPLNGNTSTNINNGNGQPNNNNGYITTHISSTTPAKIPTLRLLSNTPVGGFGASTTASTTVVRWTDRGRGNVLETREDNLNVSTLSNTLLPRIYESSWNKNLTAFIAFTLPSDATDPTALYAEIRAQATSTGLASQSSASSSSNTITKTPFSLKGRQLPDHTIAIAVSPKKDKVFMLVDESGQGVGYVSTFNGGSMTKIFSTPLLQVNVEWPEDNTIAITTKGTVDQQGFLYFVDPVKGTWKKILGPIFGLSTKTSHDAKSVIYSKPDNQQGISTIIHNVTDGTEADALIKTLADKCVWGNFYKKLVYCAVPAQPIAGTYPDDWYKGDVSFPDKIWQVNAETKEVHLISSIVDQSDRIIDAYDLGLDEKDNFLVFMNKNDLSLWSLDLVRKN